MLSFACSVPLFPLFLFSFLAFLSSFVGTQNSAASVVSCAPSGIWGDWAIWSSCDPNLNIQRRIRPCNAQPTGCTPSKPYNCAGSYAEVKQCGDGGWNAQMLQSLSINRQYPAGALPPGSSFSAGMVQAMNINDTYGTKQKQ
ncbi:hypothetical protein niasHS_013470 [Heterodera schachtii]|uniref:Gland protein n=1 Tax=Heterodera schachtii TaxID=97005 RepID=A0ABD2IFQ2_HETSC